MNVFVFDIATIPDIDGCRRLYDLHGLSDEDVAKAVFHMRRQATNAETLPHYLHKIVTISALLHSREQFKIWSLGDDDSGEADLMKRFFSGIERYTPTLVSWNGHGFHLPVIHYRSLLYPISAGHYWENGKKDDGFRDNNYFNRYHDRHIDLMDVLAAYSQHNRAPLDEISRLYGFPGTMGMNGPDIWAKYLEGDIKTIRDNCETAVLNTYLVYLNYERNRANLDPIQYQQECQRVRDALTSSGSEHLQAFEKAWIEL